MRYIFVFLATFSLTLLPVDMATAQKKKQKAVAQKPSGDENDYYKLLPYTLCCACAPRRRKTCVCRDNSRKE